MPTLIFITLRLFLSLFLQLIPYLKRDNLYPRQCTLNHNWPPCDLNKASLFNQFFKSVYTTSEKRLMPPSLLQASLVLTHSMISKLQNKRYSQHCATSTRTKLLAWTQLGLKYLKAAVKACTRSFTISSASPYIPVQSPLSGNFTALYRYIKRGINAQSRIIDPSPYWVPYRKCWKS